MVTAGNSSTHAFGNVATDVGSNLNGFGSRAGARATLSSAGAKAGARAMQRAQSRGRSMRLPQRRERALVIHCERGEATPQEETTWGRGANGSGYNGAERKCR